MIFFVFGLAVFLSYPVAASAQGSMPVLNVEAGCRQAALSAADNRQVTFRTCMDDEQSARVELEKGWSQFAADDRERCLALTRTGGNPSYVEVLECVRMAQDARELEKKEPSR